MKHTPPVALFDLPTPNRNGQNNAGLDREWSALTGRHERRPQIVNAFGKEFPAASPERDRERERASRNEGANVVRIIIV